MLKHTTVTQERVKQFIQRELADHLVRSETALKTEFCGRPHTTEHEARTEGPWQQIEPGFTWGPAYRVAWYRVTGTVPAAWPSGESAVTYGRRRYEYARADTPEGTVWMDGQPVAGIDYGHQVVRLKEGTRSVDMAIKVYARNSEATVHGPEPKRKPEPELFEGFYLVSLDSELTALFYDCQFCFNLLGAVPETDPSHAALLRALNDVCNAFDRHKPRTISRCRRIIKDAVDNLGGDVRHTITPVGHAHLDTAWLWPLAITRLKMAHTTVVQLDLMDRYPEHVFAHSQASQYEWLEREHPELLERVKRAARRGQWEPVGSMWVEADCNLTGGEALVRQFLYGRRYFKRHFGTTTHDMWLPDVFGYSAALPQILTKFGIKYFLTQKLSWNQYNKPPHHTFWWQGIDGSRVWTHFPPADTYVASGEPKEILESVRKFKDHGRSDRSLLLFGFGDGGGGPAEWHLEMLRRGRRAPCMPEIETRRKALDFFRSAYDSSEDLATWVGELYFELHRGTYTSQAANKKANRYSEFLLRDAELLSCFRDDFPSSYPAADLEQAWKLTLLNQFHDIIPGSSVKEVYEDSAKDYAEIKKIGERIVKKSLEKIGSKLDTRSMRRPVAIFHNSTIPSQAAIPWTEDEPPSSLRVAGEDRPVQLIDEFGERKIIFATPHEALGAVAACDLDGRRPVVRARLKAAPRKIESDDWAVRFDANGNITSVQSLDDNPTEFIAPGQLANMFQIFDDHPLFWDAWDTEIYSLETGRDLARSDSVEIVERGPVRVAVEVAKSFGASKIRQRISLGPTPGIRFDTWVDWREENKMLKVAFPLNVNSQKATFEIQFGHVERPTHQNTSWDMAKFEVCAQKWADLSEGGHGAALLNDGKYGHDVRGNTLRLTLLRSPKSPDPQCDMGIHRFTYVLLPHYDQIQHSDVVDSAYALNAPVRWAYLKPSPGAQAEMPRLVGTDDRNVIVESVKKAEDSGRIIVRCYECHNNRGTATLQAAVPVKRAWLTDLNEVRQEELEIMDGSVRFHYKPFEILTFLLEV